MQAYSELLEEEAINIPAWFSFTSNDGINVVSGDSIQDCASIADSCEQVVGVGINCTPPRYIHGLIQSIQKVSSFPTCEKSSFVLVVVLWCMPISVLVAKAGIFIKGMLSCLMAD